MAIRTLIVDDEPHARDWVRSQLVKDPEIEVVGECGDGLEAALEVDALRPDLIFLDIQMPGLDGFGVLDALPPERLPAVVFVTAFDQYALRAFEVHAVDYILKPFGPERLGAALARVKKRLAERQALEIRDGLASLLAELRTVRSYPEWLLVKGEGKSFLVRVREIDWVEASRNNVLLHVGKTAHSYRETTQGMEAKLDPKLFLRIHRSTIVNLERVQDLEPWFNGDTLVTLKDGTRLTMSATYRSRLKELTAGVSAPSTSTRPS